MKTNKQLVVLGSNIREIRKSKNLSQEQLALKAGIDRSYIGGVERGERNISTLMLVKIAECLECPLSILVKDLPNE